jgi:hypothetical protein
VTSSLNGWLKLLFQHPRPYWLDKRVVALATDPAFGMPSGHSQNAMAMWAYLSRLYQHKKWLFLAAIGIIFLTGVSRIYLGIHFADQVLIGWLVGAFLVWAIYRIEPFALRLIRKLSLLQLILVIGVISLGMICLNYFLIAAARPVPESWQVIALAAAPDAPVDPLNASDGVSLAGISLGLAGGAAWDWRKHGPLPIGGSMNQKIYRYLLGLIGLAVLYFGLKLILPDTMDFLGQSLRYLQFALVGLWVTLFAPALFRRVRLV